MTHESTDPSILPPLVESARLQDDDDDTPEFLTRCGKPKTTDD